MQFLRMSFFALLLPIAAKRRVLANVEFPLWPLIWKIEEFLVKVQFSMKATQIGQKRIYQIISPIKTMKNSWKKMWNHLMNSKHLQPFYHPWFPTKKASKLTFFCFQLQLFSTTQGLKELNWKQQMLSFEAFLVGN